MTPSKAFPIAYDFEQAEIEAIAAALNTPAMQAYLGSLEATALASEYTASYEDKLNTGADLATRLLINNTFIRGQLTILAQLRNLQTKKVEGAE